VTIPSYASSAFIWDQARARNRTVEIFGEYVGYMPDLKIEERPRFFEQWKNREQFVNRFHTVAPIAAINPFVAKDFPAYGGQVPAVVRAHLPASHPGMGTQGLDAEPGDHPIAGGPHGSHLSGLFYSQGLPGG
jgi:hypothetical protein